MHHVPLALFLAFLALTPVVQAVPCEPTRTDSTRLVVTWAPPPVAAPEGWTLRGIQLQRVGSAPHSPALLAPDVVEYIDEVPPGAHGYEVRAAYAHSSGLGQLSPLAPMGTPQPCVVVGGATPTILSLVPTSTMDGGTGMHLKWALAGPDRLVEIARRVQTAGMSAYVTVAMAPGGFFLDLHQLTTGEGYCYRVRAHTPESAWSEETCAVFTLGQ